MEFADYLSAFEDFLRTKETFRCSSEEMDSFLQTLSIAEENRDLVKKTTMKNPPPTLQVHDQTVSLSSCYIDSIKQMQDVLQKDRTGKLGHIMQQIRKLLGHTQSKMFWEISTILEISGEDRVSVRICEKKQRLCEAKVKMHQYLLLEGLQDVVACLSEIGNSSLEDVWKSCKSSSAPLAMQKVGMNQSKFEKTLESYPEAFQVEDGKVFLKDNPQITYSLILCHMQSAQHKLKDHLYNQGALLKNELFRSTSQLLSRAEILAMGEGLESFTFTLQSLCNDFLLIPPHMLVVARGTSQVQDNPFVSAVSKIKDFIRGENAGNGTFMSQLLTFVNKKLDPCEQAAVGSTSQKLKETIAAYPGHFIIGHNTVFVESDDAILLDVTNIEMQNLVITKVHQEISSGECSPDQDTESFEDLANSDSLDQETGSSQTDDDVCSSVQYTEQSEGFTNSGYLHHDTGSLDTENEARSSVQNTELPEHLANSDIPCQDKGSSHTDNDVCSTVQNTKCLEDSVISDTSDRETSSPCTDDDGVCSSFQDTEHDKDFSNSVTPDQDTGSPHTNDGVFSSIQDTGHPEDLANSDPLDQESEERGSPRTDSDVCTSVQNPEHPKYWANSETPDQGTGSPCTDDDVCSSVQNTEHNEDFANSDPSHHDTASPDADADACSSVQNTVHNEDLSNYDTPDRDTGTPCTDDGVCNYVQNTEHDENLSNFDTPDRDTGSPCIDDVCSSVQNAEHSEDFAISDPSHHDTASPDADADACSSVHNIEHPEVLANYDTSEQDTGSYHTNDGVHSSVQNTEHDKDFSNSVTPDQDTGSPHTKDGVFSSIQDTGHPEDLANSDPLDQESEETGSPRTDSDVCTSVQNPEHPKYWANSETPDQGTGSPCTDDDVCSSVQNTEHNEDFANSDPSHHDTASPDADADACSSVQNTVHNEDLSNYDTPDRDTGTPCTDDGVCNYVQNTEHDENLSNFDTPDRDTGSPCIDDVCSSVQNAEHSEDFAISDPSHHDTASPDADADACSSVHNIEHPEVLANYDTSEQDTGSYHTNDGVHSSVQNTEHDKDFSNSVTPDQDTGSPHTKDGVFSSIQDTGHPEDLANSDPLDQESEEMGSPRTDSDVCTSVQNPEHPKYWANSETPDQDTGSPCTDDDVCSSVQNTEHDEDFANSDPSHHDTASPDADADACSSVQNTLHDEDLSNYDTPDRDTGASCTDDDDDVCSPVHNIEHPEVLANYDTPDHDTDSPCTADDTCTSVQKTKHSEDFPNSDAPDDTTPPDTDNDVHACSLDQTPSLGQDEVESLGSETISDSESLHSGTSSEAGNLDPDTALSESTGQDIVTILQDWNYFSEVIKEFLSKATYPILSVSLSDGWLIVGLWDGPTFAICVTPSSCDQQQTLGRSERIALDFLTSKSIVKVVFDGKQLSEINDALGIEMVKVFDLKEAESLIRPGSKYSRTLPESLNSFGIDPCPLVEVCIGTIQAPAYGEVYSKEAILKLKETARWTMKQVPYLYQKMLGLMTSYQITKVSKLYDAEVEDQTFTSSQKEEPSCSTITSSRTSPVTSSEMDSQVHTPVTSSKRVKATSEMPVSVHRVSSTSGDLDEPNSKGRAQSSDDLFDMEENLQSDLLSGPEVDANFLIRDNESGSSRSRTASRRSKKMQTAKKQGESFQQVTEGSGSTPSPMADEEGTSEQLSYMVNAKVLHYDDAGNPTLIPCASELANKAINPCQISHELAMEFGEIAKHDQEKFLEAFGICIKYNLKKLSETDKNLALDQLTEVVMDLGRKPSARYYQAGHPGQLKIKTIGDNQLTKQDLTDILEGHCSPVSSDHRSTIKGTLHRVGIMCNRQNEPIGLTTLTKHAVLGCATPLFDLMNQGQSILFVGSPGVGKSTMLREAARVINDVVMRRVVIIDTCNEIAGDGDVPHPAVGGARRVQLPDRDSQPNMIREVVRNHSPHTLVIDEVTTEEDAAAVLATRQRGIQVISAAHGQTLQDVILNPKLRHLFGGIQNMAMSHPGQGITGHTVMQRTQPAAFDILVEMYDRYRWIVHTNFTHSIDLCLQKVQVGVQERRVFMKKVSKNAPGIPQVLVQDLLVMYPL